MPVKDARKRKVRRWKGESGVRQLIGVLRVGPAPTEMVEKVHSNSSLHPTVDTLPEKFRAVELNVRAGVINPLRGLVPVSAIDNRLSFSDPGYLTPFPF